MFKWFKKHCKKLIIASSIFTACICGLFGFTKSYAYDYDNGQLVGNNLFQNKINNVRIVDTSFNDVTTTYSSYIQCSTNGNIITINLNGTFNLSTDIYVLCDTDVSWVSGMKYYPFGCTIDVLNDSLRYTPSGFTLFYKNNNNNSYTGMSSIGLGSYVLDRVGTTAWFNSYINNSNIWTNYTMSVALSLTTRWNTGNYQTTIRIAPYLFTNSFNIEYAFSSPITFVPYSSIEQLQEAYDSLQQQYNEYVASHSHTDTEYNDLVSANSSLQQQLSTLQAQYDVYVATHTHTDTEYNNLLDGYDDLLDTQRELESDYNELQTAYNTMKVNYDTLNNAINYGIFAYIDGYNYGEVLQAGVFFYGNYNNSTYYIMPPSGSDYIWSFNDLIEEGLLESGGILRIDKITERSDYNSNVNYSCQIRLNHMPITSFYIDVQNMNGAYIQVRDYSSTQRTVSFTTNSSDHTFTYQNIYTVDNQFNNEISDIIISPQFTSSSILGQAIGATASIQSYNNGYNDGVNFMSYYKNEYDTLSREYDSARRDIATLRELNESLNEQISSNLGWKSLFFAMADTPLKTVSNVLGFELFGVNLFTTFIGMVTVLGIVFLLKKLI